jgi:hypothetical protein
VLWLSCIVGSLHLQVDKRDGSGEKVLMQSRRIDGGTTLEAREAAIQEFNRPDTGEVAAGPAAAVVMAQVYAWFRCTHACLCRCCLQTGAKIPCLQRDVHAGCCSQPLLLRLFPCLQQAPCHTSGLLQRDPVGAPILLPALCYAFTPSALPLNL